MTDASKFRWGNFVGAVGIDIYEANPQRSGISGLGIGAIVTDDELPAYLTKMRDIASDPRAQLRVTLPIARLKEDERGTVVSPIATVRRGDDVATRQVIDPQEIRASLILFDRLEVPADEGFREEHDDLDFLKAEGLLQRSYVCRTTDYRALVPGQSGRELLAALLAREPGRWSVSRQADEVSVFDPLGDEPSRCATLSLASAVPIPDVSVPLEEVLEFKRKRSSELQALRKYLDELQVVIAEADEPAKEWQVQADHLQEAIRDYLRASKSCKFPLRLSSYKMKIDRGTLRDVASGYAGAASFGMSPAISALTGLAYSAFLSLSSEVSLTPKVETNGAFEYVSLIRKELFAGRRY